MRASLFGNFVNWSLGKFFVSYPFEHVDILLKTQYGGSSTCNRVEKPAKNLYKTSPGFVWINNPHYNKNFPSLVEHLDIVSHKKTIFISCCNNEFAEYFSDNHYESIKVGKEAILNLNENHFTNSRLRESIRAELRHGTTCEYIYCQLNVAKLEEFKLVSRHGKEPQLKYFFNVKFTPNNRLFILEDKTGRWLGALLLFKADNEKYKTDLILRRDNAPNGVMEALIYETINRLKSEGYLMWSLGEVPYIVYDSCFLSKEYFVNTIGRNLKFAYNYSGLYKFKNKFNPTWNDVFICSSRGLNLTILFKVFIRSSLIQLVMQKLLFKIKAA